MSCFPTNFRDADRSDLNFVYFNAFEFADLIQFRMDNGSGQEMLVEILCQWDTDITKKRGAVIAAQGVFFGDVCVYFKRCDLPRRPLAGEFIWAKQPELGWQIFEIAESDETEGLVELTLKIAEQHAY